MECRHKIQLLFGIIPLVIGGLIYVCFRSRTLLMFSWFSQIQWDYSLLRLNYQVSDFIKFSLPDGLWLLAYQLIVAAIWKNRMTVTSVICIYSMPLFILVEEVFQGIGLVKGTFDYCDLVSYSVAIVLATIVIRIVQ